MIARLILTVALLVLHPQMLCGQELSVFEGTFVKSFEVSNFYANGNCSTRAYWLEEAPESGLHGKLNEMGFYSKSGWSQDGSPSARFGRAVRLRFEGSLSAPGAYGHLNQYRQMITVIRVLNILPAEACAR